MKVLITGGAGYIGSHCAKACQAQGAEVHILDNLSTGHRHLAKFGSLHEVDLLDEEAVSACVKSINPDGLIHFAARSLVGESVEKPELYFRNNVTGSLNLFEAAAEAGVKAVIMSSSAATYGEPEEQPICEETPQRPINPYGESKLMMEREAEWIGKKAGFKVGVLRYFNVIGSDPDAETWEQHEPETHLVPNILKAHVAGKNFKLFGNDFPTKDGTCIRDYVDVNDLGAFHWVALKKLLSGAESFRLNVGNGEGASNLQIFSIIEELLGEKVKWEYAPRRAGDPPCLIADVSKLRQQFPDFKFRSVNESLRNLIDLYKANRLPWCQR